MLIVCVCVCVRVCVCVCASVAAEQVLQSAPAGAQGQGGDVNWGVKRRHMSPGVCVCACMYVSMYVFVCVVCVREKCVMSHDVRASAYVYRVCVLAYVCVSTCAFVCVSVCLCLCLSLSVSVPLSEQGT